MPRSIITLFSCIFLYIVCGSIFKNKDRQIIEDNSCKNHFPNEDFFNARNYPETTFDYKSYFKDIDKLRSTSDQKVLEGEWVDQGPGNIGARINSMAINPNDENEIYLGYARGGLYKTVDGGQNWTDVFREFSYLGISSVVFDPSDSNTVYIGTGDKNISHYPGIGNGVYKTTDGGQTWTHLGLSDASIISRVAIHQQDPNIIYASSMGIPFEKNNDKGVYKSLDGGSNWEQVLFVNDSTGIIDMKVAPGNSDIIYATGWNRIRNNNISKVSGPDAKIWRSMDGGSNWEILENGLPEGEFVRIGIDLFGEDGSTIFAVYSARGDNEFCSNGGINFYGIYKSTDFGDTWERTEDGLDNGLDCSFTGGFAWYFTDIVINPNNEDDICLSGVYMMRKDPSWGGWRNMIWEVFEGEFPHVDFHDMVFVGDNLYAATDGGAYRYNEIGGWVDIENIPTNQFYRTSYNPHEPNLYYGGLQDNGVVGGSEAIFNEWFRISGGDGFQILFDPEDPNIVYTESQNGALRVSTNGGQDFTGFSQGLEGDRNWDMQYIISTATPGILFTGTDRMHRHDLPLESDWYAISEDLTDAENDPLGFYEHNITCLSESAINPDILYCGTSDGFVWVSEDFGGTWNKITDNLPRRWISDIKPSPSSERTVYVSVSGYKNNDFTPHIYRSDNAGENWQSISSNLPNFAINDIYILPNTNDEVIFVATEVGVYATVNAGENWERLGNDFPFIQCLDMEFNPVKNQLIVATYGKGLRTFDLSQLEISSNENIFSHDLLAITPTISSDYIFLSTQGKFDKLSIFDAQGRFIKLLGEESSEINISELEPGMYFLMAEKDEEVQTKRFVKI